MGATKNAEDNLQTRTPEKVRILVADSDRQQTRRLVDFFKQQGFEGRSANTASEFKLALERWTPKVLLTDLLFPEFNAFQVLKHIQQTPQLRQANIAVMVSSAHQDQENIEKSLKWGARDFIIRPYLYQDLLQRVVLQCRDPRSLQPTSEKNAANHWHLVELILTQALSQSPLTESLYHITRMLAKKLGGVRCSIVRVNGSSEGVVVASSDKADISGYKLQLVKYPEVHLVMNTKRTLAIDNLSKSRALGQIKKSLKEVNFNSMIVCPLYYKNHPFGVISIRMPEKKRQISEDDIRFMDMCSKVISLTLKSRPIDELSPFGLIPA